MTQIQLPFQEQWREKMLSGQKECTSRPRRYGVEGDTFEAFGATFKLTALVRIELSHVAEYYYKLEGCESPEHFMRVWVSLHRRKGWVPMQKVWTHFWLKEKKEG